MSTQDRNSGVADVGKSTNSSGWVIAACTGLVALLVMKMIPSSEAMPVHDATAAYRACQMFSERERPGARWPGRDKADIRTVDGSKYSVVAATDIRDRQLVRVVACEVEWKPDGWRLLSLESR